MGTSKLGIGKATINIENDMTASGGICKRGSGWVFRGRSSGSLL